MKLKSAPEMLYVLCIVGNLLAMTGVTRGDERTTDKNIGRSLMFYSASRRLIVVDRAINFVMHLNTIYSELFHQWEQRIRMS